MNTVVLQFQTRGVTSSQRKLRAVIARTPAIMNARIQAGVSNAVREVAEEELKDVTPVLTGRLQASTTGMVVPVPGGGFMLVLEQPATNAQGQQYGRIVVTGHYTLAGTFVPPNPYPQQAMDNMRSRVNKILKEIAAQIRDDVTHVLGSTT